MLIQKGTLLTNIIPKSMLRKLLGLSPIPTNDGAYSPSRFALRMATSTTTDYDSTIYPKPYTGFRKVMMVCTEDRNLTMANGKKFSTGNHPVEMLVTMLHLKAAGFEIDVFTPTGKSVKVEQWAMPHDDVAVTGLYSEFKPQFNSPGNLSKFVSTSMEEDDSYAAIFLPGGQGALAGLPECLALKELILWACSEDLFILSICHGPAALLAASMELQPEEFVFSGYSMAAFPDSVDRMAPMIGYLPGHMPYKFGERLQRLGVTLVNKKADSTCHVDRKLITGASPEAANDFGRLVAQQLLSFYQMDGAHDSIESTI